MRSLMIILAFWLAGTAHAGGIDRLKAFVAGARTAEAEFAQTVSDRNGRVIQQASGTMAFSRPGKFRWDYTQPYQQTIVGDGSKLWLYDADLDQVTVKPLNEALSGTPAALLAGNHAIEKYFSLRNAGTAGGLEWLEAIPRSKDTTFERIRMGFRGNTLAQMELIDQLGQRTMLTFTNFSRNPAIPASRFRFSPPKGTDVIGG